MASVLRPLSPVERTLWRLSAGASLNFTTVAHIRGALDLSSIGRGLIAAQERHPLLRATIEAADPAIPVFLSNAAGPLRVRLGSNDWRAEVERELMEPMNAQLGPLARAVWVPEAGGGRLLLTLHHAIGDAWSGVYALRDALTSIAAQGQRTRSLAPIEDAEAVDDCLAARGTGFVGALSAFVETVRRTIENVTVGRPVSPRADNDVDCTERRVRFIPVEIDPDTTAALTARARKEGTTVHGALLAAMALGIAEDLGKKAPMGLGTAVDLRPTLDPSPGDGVGLYVSMLPYRKRVAPDDDIWELASSIRQSVHSGLDSLRAHSTVNVLPVLYRACGGAKASATDFALAWEKKASTTTGLTNLGKLNVETEFPQFRVESYQFAINPSAMGTYAATAACTNGQLNWNFMFGDPTFDLDHAEGLVSKTLDRLLGALDPEA